MHNGTVGRPFKCQTPENAEAWQRLAEEFFGRFVENLAVAPLPTPVEPPPALAPAAKAGLSPAVWVPALIVVVLALLWLLTR